MLQCLVLAGVVLTSNVIAAPHPPAERAERVERAWSSWNPSPYSSTYQPPTTNVVTPSPTPPSTIAPISTAIASSPSSTAYASAGASGACASVAQLVAAFSSSATATSASASATATVPAQLAFECLNSIPFNQSAAVALLNAIDPYLSWQSTFEYLKYPPAEYAEKVQPPYDFFATWDAIKANTSAGAYQSEYEFGWTVYRAAQLTHDGHFVFYIDSVTELFSFARDLPLVSVSLDGVSEPQVYLHSDIVASVLEGSFSPSPIIKIDGQNATEYLLTWSQYGSLQDPDALWNNLFWEPAQVALGTKGTGVGTFSGGGRGQWPYPGPSTTLTFANGTTISKANYANVLQPTFGNITSGEDVYETYLAVGPDAYQNAFQSYSSAAATSTMASASVSASPTAATSSAPASSTMAPTPIPSPGYPSPFVSETNNLNAGYFIDAPGYEDIAVLVVRSFVGTDADEIPFQAINTYFIETAAKMNKTKLIVDVSANGGGTILQGFDLFKQLFPSILPYGASRYAAHEAFNLMGIQDSYLSGLVPRSLNDNATYQDLEAEVWNYRDTNLNVDYEPFTSWAELYGPHALGPEGDNFTSIIRWNLSDILIQDDSGGIDISGYINRTNITAQPFEAENIIIVTDGYCASTCTIFTELMTNQGGVKTVALGGRPQPGPMQAIGGVKGTNDVGFDFIFEEIGEIYGASNESLQNHWDTTVLADYTSLPFERALAMNLNVRNGYLPDDDTPLQFVYQPADCRILYTPQMIVDETAVWKTVADSVWGGGAGNACVAGGFNVGGSSTAEREVHAARDGISHDEMLESHSVKSEDTLRVAGEALMIV